MQQRQNLTFEIIVERLAIFSDRWLLVEFIIRKDNRNRQVQRVINHFTKLPIAKKPDSKDLVNQLWHQLEQIPLKPTTLTKADLTVLN